MFLHFSGVAFILSRLCYTLFYTALSLTLWLIFILAGSIDVQIHHWDFQWEWALDVVGELKKHDGYCNISIWHFIVITCINWIYKGIWLWVMINESDLDLHTGVFPYWPIGHETIPKDLPLPWPSWRERQEN